MVDHERKEKWTVFDRFLANRRLSRVTEYISKKDIVLDVGCGRGDNLKALSSRIKKGVGVDLFDASFSQKNLKFIKADFDNEKLPIEPKSIDRIIFLAVLEHLNNPEKVTSEFYRALKPGGLVILTTPSPYAKPILETLAKLQILNKDEILDHKHYFSKSEIYNLFTRYKFKQEKLSYFQVGMNICGVFKK